MKKLLLVLLCLFVAFPLFARDRAEYNNPTLQEYSWYVREMDMHSIVFEDGEQTERYYTEYFLFFGNELAEKINYDMSAAGVMFAIYMFKSEDREEREGYPLGWRLELVDNTRNMYYVWPTMAEDVWPELPDIMKHTLKALGVRAPGLVMIYFTPYSNTVSVFYKSSYGENENFYKAKLRKLQYYFDNLESLDDIENPWQGEPVWLNPPEEIE